MDTYQNSASWHIAISYSTAENLAKGIYLYIRLCRIRLLTANKVNTIAYSEYTKHYKQARILLELPSLG